MKDILNLLEKLERAEAETRVAEIVWEDEPENELLESNFEAAYKIEYSLYVSLAGRIVAETAGQISFDTAKKMIKTQRTELKKIFQKVA